MDRGVASAPAPAEERVRTFVAVCLPPPLLESLTLLQRRLESRPEASPVRWATPPQLHLTLKFLGNVPRADLDRLGENLTAAVAGLGPFDLRLAGLGCFPHARNPRVVWVGVTGALPQLEDLHRRLENALRGCGDHPEEARPFQPHLTIGRVNARGDEARRLGDLLARERVPELGLWPVREVVLFRSDLGPQGARHTVLASVPLRGPGGARSEPGDAVREPG